MGDPTDEYLLGLVDEEEDKYAYNPSLRGGNDDAGQNQVEYVEETVPNWLQYLLSLSVCGSLLRLSSRQLATECIYSGRRFRHNANRTSLNNKCQKRRKT